MGCHVMSDPVIHFGPVLPIINNMKRGSQAFPKEEKEEKEGRMTYFVS